MALYISAHRGHVDALQYLLELGNSAESTTWSGWEDIVIYLVSSAVAPYTPVLTHQTRLLRGSYGGLHISGLDL